RTRGRLVLVLFFVLVSVLVGRARFLVLCGIALFRRVLCLDPGRRRRHGRRREQILVRVDLARRRRLFAALFFLLGNVRQRLRSERRNADDEDGGGQSSGAHIPQLGVSVRSRSYFNGPPARPRISRPQDLATRSAPTLYGLRADRTPRYGFAIDPAPVDPRQRAGRRRTATASLTGAAGRADGRRRTAATPDCASWWPTDSRPNRRAARASRRPGRRRTAIGLNRSIASASPARRRRGRQGPTRMRRRPHTAPAGCRGTPTTASI